MSLPPSPGTIFIISAPSGTGKTTLIDRVKARFPDIAFPVTMTTRPMRPGECDGVDYHFVDRERFMAHVAAGDLVEWTTVYDRLYGVPRSELEIPLAAGRDVLFDIDTKGRETVVGKYPGAVSIFIAPPSIEELERRLKKRGQNEGKDLENRLAEAAREIARASRYDHVILNDDIERAYAELSGILAKEQSKRRGGVAGH